MHVRSEDPADAASIRAITRAAFADAPHSSCTEAAIVDALRVAGALSVSLVAVEQGEVIGHAAFSPVTIQGRAGGDGRPGGWFGLGPVSVRPDRQGAGIGQALIRRGLEQLVSMAAGGCVVLGDPGYYGRFGFTSDPGLRYGGAPPEYFQRLVFKGPAPLGKVAYHEAFGAE